MQIISVVPISRGLHVPMLDYFTAKNVSLGDCVEVPLGKSTFIAVVAGISSAADAKHLLRTAEFSLTNIVRVLPYSPISERYIQTCLKVSLQTGKEFGVVVKALLPKNPIMQWLNDGTVDTEDMQAKYVKDGKDNIKSLMAGEVKVFEAVPYDQIAWLRTVCREQLAKQKSLWILAPTGRLVKKYSKLVSAGIASHVIEIHNDLSKNKLTKQYKTLAENSARKIVVTTPYFLHLCKEVGHTMICLDEGDEVYSTITQPPVDTRIIIYEFARISKANLVAVDVFVSDSAYAAADQAGGDRVQLKNYRWQRQLVVAEFAEAESRLKKNELLNFFAEQSIKSLAEMKESEKALVYTHRKGLASTVVCQDCGFVLKDISTGLPYRLVIKSGSRWFESYGGKKILAFDDCPTCSGNRLKPLGATTRKLSQVLKDHFKDTHTIVVIDADSVATKTAQKQAQHLVDTSKKPLIVVGTRKVFSSISCLYNIAIIANISGLLAVRRYDMLPRACWQLAHCAVRTDGMVLVQTKKINHPVIGHIQQQTLKQGIEKDHQLRKTAKLWPWYRILLFEGSAKHKVQHEYLLKLIKEIISNEDDIIFFEQDRDSLKIKGIWHTSIQKDISETEWRLRELFYEYDFKVSINPLQIT